MNDMAERYVREVSQRLPAHLRQDVAEELRTTIADMADGREGPDPVREVLLELGDPAELARSYRGGPRHLIGPAVFDEYVTLLKTLAATVLPALLLIFSLLELADPDRPLVEGILSAVGTTLSIAVHIAFWATLTFAVLEWTGWSADGHRRSDSWDPDRLPSLPSSRQIGLGDTVGAIVILAAMLVFLPVQRVRSGFQDAAGDPVPLLADGLWPGWALAFAALVVVMMAVEVWKYRVGRWTLPLVVGNLIVDVAFVGFLFVLTSSADVLNPAWIEGMRRATPEFDPDSAVLVVLVIVVGIVVWDAADSVAKHLRLRQETSRTTGPASSIPA